MGNVVITGGCGGLASAIADGFRNAGWQVAAPGRRELDVIDPASIARFFADRVVDLLVCAAGITRDAPLARLEDAAWDEVMAVNFRGAAACARAAVPAMAARRSGHIVFISSHSALHPPAGQAAYAAAKAALLGLTADLARRHGPDGIRINAVLPGFLETPMTATVTAKRRQEILSQHALERFNTPAAVADFVRHLHESLPHTSGQTFQLDSRPA